MKQSIEALDKTNSELERRLYQKDTAINDAR